MKEQVLCPSCLAEEVLEEAGYCSLGKEGLHRCKRNTEHKEFPATLGDLAGFMQTPIEPVPLPSPASGMLSDYVLVLPTTPFTAESAPVNVLYQQGFELTELETVVLQNMFHPPIKNRVYINHTNCWLR